MIVILSFEIIGVLFAEYASKDADGEPLSPVLLGVAPELTPFT